MKLLRRVMFGWLFLLVVTATLTWGEDDPPGRVARLQYIQGSVSVQPRGADGWVAATVNRPLTTSDNIWADKDSRAELNVGTGVLRMNGETSLTLTNVADNTVQVQLHQGTVNLRVRRLYPGEIYELDTPNVAFTVQKTGRYRFDVDSNGDVSYVTVWKGEGDATGNGPAVRVRAHERARFSGTYLAHEIDRAPGYDGFDDWCLVRDRRQDHAISAQYVSPAVIGYEDLDDYGSWRVLPTYGPVWVPGYVVAGWSPYHYGHWVWVSPWGWTWVDDAPWGFAPFHYGRWVYAGYWAWVPGPVYVRPVYAPALVAWFGGGNFSIGLAFGGGYGWCPLGYGEPYVPWYYGSRHYFQRVNITNTHITNVTYITNNYYGRDNRRDRPIRYRNMNAPGAVTVASHRTIIDSLPVAKTAIAVTPQQAKEWGRNPVKDVSLSPTRDSMLGPAGRKPAVIPPEHVVTRPVLTKLAPPVTPAKVQPNGPPFEVRVQGAAPARLADNEVPSGLPKPARVIPRPPQTGPDKVLTAPGIPKLPTVGNSEARRTEPGIARVVPRPPEVTRGRDERDVIRPTAPPNSDVARPKDGPVHSTLPAVRQIPRPPVTDNVTARDDDSRTALPRSSDAGRHNDGVPRPIGPVAPPRSDSGDSPRVAPPVYRPSGPDEHRAITPPSAAPTPRYGDGSGPRPGGNIPRSSGDGPRMMQAPPAPRSVPQAAPPSSNPAPAPPSAPRSAAPSGPSDGHGRPQR